jgi:hypothetical protein
VTGVSVRDVLFKPSALSMNYKLIEREVQVYTPNMSQSGVKNREHDFLIYG